MTDEVNYRSATIKDVDELVSMQEKLALLNADVDKYYSLQPTFKKQIKTFFTENVESKKYLFYLAQSQGKIIGYIVCNYSEGVPIFKYRKQVAVTDIFVEPAYRRMRVAKRLFHEAKNFAKRSSSDFIVLNVDLTNTDAINFYTKSGLKPLMTKMIMRVE